VDYGLPFTPPDHPTVDFHRGNFSGHRVPGLPYVPGCTENDPSLLYTWFLYEYSREWQERILDSYQSCGYTHISFHRADWMGVVDGVPGCSRETALDLVRRCRDRGLYVVVNLAIDGQPTPEELTPWIADLAGAGMAIGCLAWQINQLLAWPDIFDYIDWVCPAIAAAGCKRAIHWSLDACAVWPSAKFNVWSRRDFQQWTADKIEYVYQQFNTEMPLLDMRPHAGGLIGEQQDVLKTLAGQKLVVAEDDAQAEFDDPAGRPELYGDLKGRCLMATSYDGHWCEGGYLNGARQPDGSVL